MIESKNATGDTDDAARIRVLAQSIMNRSMAFAEDLAKRNEPVPVVRAKEIAGMCYKDAEAIRNLAR